MSLFSGAGLVDDMARFIDAHATAFAQVPPAEVEQDLDRRHGEFLRVRRSYSRAIFPFDAELDLPPHMFTQFREQFREQFPLWVTSTIS